MHGFRSHFDSEFISSPNNIGPIGCSFTFTFNPIQDGGGGKKALHTSFSFVTSEKVGISSQNFLNFSLNPCNTLVQNFKVIPSASPKLLNLNEDHPLKKERFFWSNPYEIEVMKTSLIEMLQIPNFGNMPTPTT